MIVYATLHPAVFLQACASAISLGNLPGLFLLLTLITAFLLYYILVAVDVNILFLV